jgi:Flp pilus assembly protein TadG
MNTSRRVQERGQIVIIFAISLVILIGMLGLVIDAGCAYGVRAKLSTAVDAAALAGGRALSTGATESDRIANAQLAAARYYAANFPNGYLGATRNAPSIAAVHDALGFWTISVTGSATMPITLLGIVGVAGPVQVGSAGTALRRDVDVMLVLDTSGSLGNPPGTLDSLKSAAVNSFVNRFASGVGGDRVGLVSFASGAVLDVPIDKTANRGFNRTAVTNGINALSVSGSTAQAEGFRRAVDEINLVPASLRSGLRVIVFFSDGAPNDVSAAFTRTPGGQVVTGDLYSETASPGTSRATNLYSSTQRDNLAGTYTDIATLPTLGLGNIPLASYRGARTLTGSPVTNTRCNVNKAARNMVENEANSARGQGILVMTVGLGAALNSLEIGFCSYGTSEWGANILNRLANTASADSADASQPTGIYCYAGNSSQLSLCFDRIANAILRLTM